MRIRSIKMISLMCEAFRQVQAYVVISVISR